MKVLQSKKRTHRILSLICVCTMLAGIFMPGAFGGTILEAKAAGNAIEISKPEELSKIGKDAGYPMNGDYVLTSDLDMSGIDFTPIGGTHGGKGAVSGSNVFTGTFDGKGHLISNLKINVKETMTTDYAQIGLFSVIASQNASDYAEVRNLVFANVDVTADISGGWTAAGTLAGEVNGYATVENICVLDGRVTVNGANQSDTVGAGGVIGECRTSGTMGNNNITIKNIYNGAEILVGSSTDINYTSGIVGRVSQTPCKEISACVNTGRTSFKGDLGMGITTFNNVNSSFQTNTYFLFNTGRASASVELEEDVLKSGELPEGLSLDSWYADKGSFPLLLSCKSSSVAEYLALLGLAPEFAEGDSALSVTKDFTLPDSIGNTSVTWESSDPSVIAIEGTTAKVLGTLSPVNVVLTATTSEGLSKKFTVTVVSDMAAKFEQGYAKPGTPLTVTIEGAPADLKCTYSWSVGNQAVSGVTGNSYTPTKADLEKFIKVVVTATNYDASWEVSTYMSDLPVLYLDTEDGSSKVDKNNYKNTNFRLQGNDEFNTSSILYDGLAEIKGRGNSTWDFAASNGLKLPYKLKLDKKSDILGMGKNKHWVLLANVIDHTNMRNQLMYEFSRDIGMECFMDSKPVVLILNGEYIGFYQLCEHKRVDENRIDVFDWEGLGEDIAGDIAKGAGLSKSETSDLEEQMVLDFSWYDTGKVIFKGKTYNVSDYYKEEIPEFTGGFVFDMDFRIDDSKHISKFRTRYGYPMIFEAPEYAKTSDSMMNYAKTYLQAFEDALHDDDYYIEYDGKEVHYSELYDIDSLLQNWFLVEYSMNWDGMKNSTLMYKDLDGLLTMGPAWDFDWGFGNINMYSNSQVYVIEGWHTTQDSFCEQAYQRENWNRYLIQDPYFATLAFEKWQEIRGTVIEDMIQDGGKIDTLYEDYSAASHANDAKWEYSYNRYHGKGVTNGQVVNKQSEKYDDAVNSLKYFIKNRVAWFDKQFTSVDNLLKSWGRYQGSNALQVSDIQFEDGNKTKITASVTNANAKKIAFYVNGIRAGESAVANGSASIVVEDGALRADKTLSNTVQIRALDASGNFLKSGNNVLTNYKNFQKETATRLTGTVEIQGDAITESTLKAVVKDTNNSGTLSYQWYAGGIAIADATGDSYVLTDAEVGKKITVRVSSTAEIGYLESAETAKVEKKGGEEPDPEPVDKDGLEAAIASCDKLDSNKYTAATWEDVESALKKAKEVLDNDDATQKQVDDAKEALESAIKALVEKEDPKAADKSALQKAITKANEVDKDKYTEESVEAMEAVLTAAKDVMSDESLTAEDQAEVDNAAKALNDAIDNLKVKKVQDVFKDVDSDSWFLDYVQYVFENGIMTGLDKTHFGPAVNLSRAQFATILHRMEGEPDSEGGKTFPDVKDGEFYSEAVAWASAVGVIGGYADGNFGPADNITREQMAVMMYRYAEYKQYNTSAKGELDFADADFVSEFAQKAMEWAVGAELISGNLDGTLAPQGNTSRAVCATIIQRFMNTYDK